MAPRWIIGLAAGPGADGIEAALLQIDGQGLGLCTQVVGSVVVPFPTDFSDLLARVATPEQADVRKLSVAHQVLGELFAAAARQVADKASVSLQRVLCCGCLGFSAWHESDGRHPNRLTLGAAASLAERTGLTVVSDFAARDLAAGGQAAPITAAADYLLFSDPDEDRLRLHLGGLTQVTYLPAGNEARAVAGWDAGPGTALLDALVRQFTSGKERVDAGGRLAVQGRQIPDLLAKWLNHPFLLRRPPRGGHRHWFAEEFARQTVAFALQQNWSVHDVLCTANHFVVRAALEGITRYLPKHPSIARVLLSGPGVRNGLLWRLIEEQLAEVPLQKTDAHGVNAETSSAVAAAVLAALALDAQPASFPSATGASGPRLLGSLTPGSIANWSRCVAWMAGHHHDTWADDD